MTGSRRLVAVAALSAAVVVVAALLWWATRDDSSSPVAASAGVQGRAGDPFDQNQPEFEDVLRLFYQDFLNAGDLHRTPDEFAFEYGSGLADVAEPQVVAEYDAWRTANEAHGDSFQRVDRITSVANIADIKVHGDKVTIRDCTDEREGSEVDEVPRYVTRVVEVGNFGGLYRVTDVDVLHEGRIDSPGYGCIPEPMGKEGADTVTTVVKEYAVAQVDPRKGLHPALDAVVAGDLQADLASSLTEQSSQNISINTPTEAEVSVLGHDPRGLGIVAVVAACITYPDGVFLRNLSSGEVIREALRPGTQTKVTYAVRLNDVDGPVAYSVVAEEMKTTC